VAEAEAIPNVSTKTTCAKSKKRSKKTVRKKQNNKRTFFRRWGNKGKKDSRYLEKAYTQGQMGH